MRLEWFIKDRKEGGKVICFSGPGAEGTRTWSNIYFTMEEWLEFSQEVEMMD